MYLLIKSPSTAVRNGNESTIPYEEVNINCAEVNATGFQDGGIYKFISGMKKDCKIWLTICTPSDIFIFVADAAPTKTSESAPGADSQKFIL